jgi:phytanoyl-CoA hydroxylase
MEFVMSQILELDRRQGDFAATGFVVKKGLCPLTVCASVLAEVRAQLDPVLAPAEFEADVGYPGAPLSRAVPGGRTPRRLLSAVSRFPTLKAFATSPEVKAQIQMLMDAANVSLSQAHHNCVMTKSPDHSSATLWHQDVRYWSFDRPELVSMWVALGEENVRNGSLRVIPGSHLLDLDRGRFDHALFLRPEVAENKALLRTAKLIELDPGDVLFFHSRLFHAAGPNRTQQVKLSAVLTYHATDNKPIPGTRSAQYESVVLP